jgi:hypothetical protein
MAAVIYPFRQNLGALAVAGQIAAGAATYGAVLLGCNFLNLRDLIVRKYFPGDTSDVTGPDALDAANAHLADAQMR